MARSNIFRVPDAAASGADRIQILMRARGFTQEQWAEANGFHASQVSMCIRGRRPYPAIRDALARFLKVSRSRLDEWIEDAAKAA